MNSGLDESATWRRRAQPLLGTLVEVGVRVAGHSTDDRIKDHSESSSDKRSDNRDEHCANAALDAAFAAVRTVQACLSRFETGSDLAHFHALPVGRSMTVCEPTRHVLAAAHELQVASGGAFDISLGTAPHGWRCEQGRLHKLDDAVSLDLGGIGKGHAVDCAVAVLMARGCAAGWVNAGGDLRVFGDAELPIRLRDERVGGTRAFASLRDGAFATSHFDGRSRSRLAQRAKPDGGSMHVSVAAPLCLWADALTKVVAARGGAALSLLARFGAQAWSHDNAPTLHRTPA